MNETLILILGASTNDPVRWAFVSEGRVLLADSAANVAALSAIAGRSGSARQVAAVIHGEDVAMRRLPSPPRSQTQFRAAAGFLLEDELAESLDDIHLAIARLDNGSGLSLAIKKSLLDFWLGALAEAGFSPDVVTADYALLPLAAGRATFLDTPDRVICAAGFSGFALDRPLADEVSASIVADEAIQEIAIYGERTMDAPGRNDVVIDWRGPLSDETLFSIFSQGLSAAPNLLQGAYRKRRDWRASAGPWRRASALAAASLAAFLLLNVAGVVRDLRTADRLKDETRALHETAFPDAAGADPRAYAREVLAAGGGRPAFLMISNAVAESISEDAGVQIDRIRYNGARGDYSINLRFSDIAQFEMVKQLLEQRGLVTSEAGGVLRTGTVYRGELRVSLS